tara:strand:+ start:224 stop:478 length:255 start_codon:yes stop_codon:yes gene_type:complete
MNSKEIPYTLMLVTEQDLRAFYDAKGKVADALYDYTQETNVGVEHEIVREIWNDNVGPSFEFLLEGVKLRDSLMREGMEMRKNE